MRKKLLIGSIVLIVLVILFLVFYWYNNAQTIRKVILSSLEQQLEFCEIIKDDINTFSNKGEFWLICNNRPFYTEYENGNITYELNGWGFLKKDSIVWNELNNCDFYDSRDSQLIFYCPKDFESDKLTARIYKFDLNSLKMNKIEEKDFLDTLSNDIRSIYSFLSECEIESFTSYKSERYPAILWITFFCEDGNYDVVTDLATIPLQPPLLINTNLSNEEKARRSFEISFGCEASNTTIIDLQVVIKSSCHARNIEMNYGFGDRDLISYRIECPENETEICLKEFGKYFIFPPLRGRIKEIKFIKKDNDLFVYKMDNKIISLMKYGEVVTYFWVGTEGIYR